MYDGTKFEIGTLRHGGRSELYISWCLDHQNRHSICRIMFDSIPFASLQLLVLMTHFVLTTGLIWTKYDCLQVTLRATASKEDFSRINRAYTGLIAFGLILLVFEMIMLTIASRKITLFGAVKLFLDIVACFFISWTILDGLEWTTYVYIFVFCV